MAEKTLSPSYDGRVYRDDDPGVYATTHDSASGTNSDDNLSSYSVINRKSGAGPEFIIVRVPELFNANAFIASDIATAAKLVIYASDVRNDDNDSLSVVDSEQASNTTLVLSDYSKIGDAVTNPTKYATDTLLSAISIGASVQIDLNSTAITAINTAIAASGIIKLGLRTAKDCSKTQPVGINYVTFDGITGTRRPELIITYTPGSVTLNAPIATINIRGMVPTLSVSLAAPIATINILGVAPTLAITGETWTNISKNSASATNISKNTISPTNVSKNSSSWSNQSKH